MSFSKLDELQEKLQPILSTKQQFSFLFNRQEDCLIYLLRSTFYNQTHHFLPSFQRGGFLHSYKKFIQIEQMT